jgi:hypothetical protein
LSSESELGRLSRGVGPKETALTREQLGHIRHIDNLSRQLPNDWSLMQTKDVGQMDFGGYRFQLSYMAYALALAHVHRLPHAPGVFKPVFERLIDKMLSPEVWLYWRDVSRGGNVFNAHLAHGYSEEWDPVAKDNIMYSAYVQSLTLLYHHLFNDDRYTKPGSLTFEYWSFFWGGEPKTFAYDEHSLNDGVYWQMVESGYIGVACEPNCAFQICNQPAILGFRMHDLITGENVADDVTRSYEKVWSELGHLDSSGHYNMFRAQDSGMIVPNQFKAPWIDAWCGTLMNMWNREYVHAHYPDQVRDFVIDGPEGTKSVPVLPPPVIMEQTVTNDTCDFGWVATWASEMGDAETLSGLLAHADRFMNPTWRDGGLYYPRHDVEHDRDGNRTLMEPLTGNALLAYARLNVPDGLWKLYNQPWTPAHFTEPALTTVGGDVEISLATFDESDGVLTFRAQRHADRHGDGTIVVSNIGPDSSGSLRVDGHELDAAQLDNGLSGGLQVSRSHDTLKLTVEAGRPRTFELHARGPL